MKRPETECVSDLKRAARDSANHGRSVFTHFLTPGELADAESVAASEAVRFASWGGFQQAERRIGCFYPDGPEPGPEDYPIVCLYSGADTRFSSITHRDVLGAFMSLGLTRTCLGDIIINNEGVYLFSEKAVAQYVTDALSSAGRVRLHFRESEAVFRTPETKGTWFRAVVSSLRLDAVAASAFRVSRATAAEWIRRGDVKVNHRVCISTDARVEGDTLLSVQKRGRVRLVSVDGVTGKQRFSVTFLQME